MDRFKKGDKVAVPSHRTGKDGSFIENIIIATVEVVGKFDLLVMPEKQRYSMSDGAFTVPKKRCVRINLDNIIADEPIEKPIIGDLVLYRRTEYSSGKVRETSGILREIIDPPWGTKKGKVMVGNKVEDFAYENLIVLERN